jgi:hypothetical protein
LFTQKHRAFDPHSQKINLWAKFNTNSFDGIQLVAWLEDIDSEVLTSGSCQFKVYYVDIDNNWGQNLIYSGSGTATGLKWTSALSQANLGAANELDGDRTLMIQATIVKWGHSFTKRIYVNHLGVYDSIVRLRNDVEFLDISKADI